MQTFLMIVNLVTSLFPIIIEAVSAIEKAFPQGGQGAAKLEMAKGILETAYSATGDASVAFEKVWPAIQSVIASVVSIKNAVGDFKTTSKPAGA